MIDYLTIQEAVTVALAKRYDGQGNKARITEVTRICQVIADERHDTPAEAFYGEPLAPAAAEAAAERLVAAALDIHSPE